MSNRVTSRRINFLKMVILVQEEYQRHHSELTVERRIYEAHIYPRFLIGYTTFRRYLEISAKKELSQIEETLKQQKELCEPSE